MTKEYILCLETSSTNCSVGLFRGSGLVAKEEINEGYSHAERLAPMVEGMLRSCNLIPGDLSAVAIGKGPGSYTGLRIGTAFAKGFCFSNDLPLIAINSLEVLASQALDSVEEKNAVLIPMLDARRMEVYTAIYDQSLKVLEPTRAEVLNHDSFKSIAGKKYCFGPGALKFMESEFCGPEFKFIDGLYPGVTGMARVVEGYFDRSKFVDLAYFEPFYLKDFVAGRPKKLL